MGLRTRWYGFRTGCTTRWYGFRMGLLWGNFEFRVCQQHLIAHVMWKILEGTLRTFQEVVVDCLVTEEIDHPYDAVLRPPTDTTVALFECRFCRLLFDTDIEGHSSSRQIEDPCRC